MIDENQQPKSTYSLNIDALFEELQLAVYWQRPSILFTVHPSAWGQKKSVTNLRNRLIEIGCTVLEARADQDQSNIVNQILGAERTEKTVFFIFNLNSGDPDGQESYRALNMHREFFIENRIKAVFWLTPREAEVLPRFAPDFWAFRHRVIEFKRSRITSIQSYLYLLSLWYSDDVFALDPDEEIQACKKSLGSLPEGAESRSIRAQIMYDLGRAHWRNGGFEDAKKILTFGLALVEDGHLDDLFVRFLNGIAAIHFQSSRYDEALKIYGELLQKYKKEAIPRMNRALVLCSMGRNHEALIQGRRAVQHEPANPKLWNRLGYVYIVAGKLEDALACYKESVRLAPDISDFHESLMMCFHLMRWRRQAIEEVEVIQRLGRLDKNHIDLFRQILMDNPEQVSSSLSSISEMGISSSLDISQNINLKIIMSN